MEDTSFEAHNAMIANLSVRFRFNQKYISRPGRKIIMSASSPEITLSYRKGIEAFGSKIDFDWASIKVKNSSRLGLLGKADYSLTYGRFLHKDQLLFLDYYHFAGNRSTMTVFTPDALQLLSYYNLSTNDQIIEGHYEHHFNGFLINKVPIIRKSKIQTVFSFNYVNTPSIDRYYEFGLSLEHIFKIARIGYYIAYQDNEKAGAGLRIGVGF